MTYKEALDRSLVVNKSLKGSCKFARPKKSFSNPKDWDVEIVDTKVLVQQHEAGKQPPII